MFTGLIKEMAKVVSFQNNFLTIRAKYRPKIGDSIAINGACLTVVKIQNDNFTVEISPESHKILAMENYKGQVHMEPAMQMGDRFEGHIVQGHIDCQGEVRKILKNANSSDFYISLPKEFLKYIIVKGSIAVDGVSLTVNEVLKNSFRLTIIPHTIENTLFKSYEIGTKVNLETDMFARYIHNILAHKDDKLKHTWEDVDRIMASY